jgi:hypothetical protein
MNMKYIHNLNILFFNDPYYSMNVCKAGEVWLVI